MKKSTYIILCVVLVALGIFFVTEIWKTIPTNFVFSDWFDSKKHVYMWGLWFLLGAIIFPLMNRFLKKNIDIVKVFTHEMCHAITALITFRRIVSFHVTEKDGVVYTSGSDKTRFLVTLAPYCFLIYTIPLLLFRCMVKTPMMPIIDILIGFTVGLHFICIKEQTRSNQPDLTRNPLYFSYIYIITIWLFDICLILLSYNTSSNIFYAFKTMGVDLWGVISSLWK